MTAPLERPASYGIEASGWDINEEFFVELSDFQWSHGGGERLTLHHALRMGSIVFLRLVHSTAIGPPFPVAYQVRTVRRGNVSGTWELELIELRRREAHPKEEPLLIPERNEELVEQQK
jgi:hypothetical protein